jgi:23S rRNA (cytosine1962-C5)-methyltransferase
MAQYYTYEGISCRRSFRRRTDFVIARRQQMRILATMKDPEHNGYELLDSGNGDKLERFGPYTLIRPCAAAVWEPSLVPAMWTEATARFGRDGGNSWTFREALPSSWDIQIDELTFKLVSTGFGHIGVFPEQRPCWSWIRDTITKARAHRTKPVSVLNLFAYSGGSTLAAARAGAEVCHLDASRGMVARARENAGLNGLDKAPIRWIVDDVTKFLDREVRRQSHYDAIILDPPSFGRGKTGELFKIETDLLPTLKRCAALLSREPLFVLLSCHTPSFTPIVLENVLRQSIKTQKGLIECGEMLLKGKPGATFVPSGTFASWKTQV